MDRELVLLSNGPGELHAFVKPVVDAVRRLDSDLPIKISLLPCQFASGNEASIARTFDVDAVTTPAQYLRAMAARGAPTGLGARQGLVLQLGGGIGLAVALARRLRHPLHRYAFTAGGHPRLERLYVPDERTRRQARWAGTPGHRVSVVGNLVADAVAGTDAIEAPGRPYVILIPGSRDGFARPLIPFMLAVADRLHATIPEATFAWPVSRLLASSTIEDGIAGVEAGVLGGVGGRRDGDVVVTPSGAKVRMIDERVRYAHMRAADLAVTIPGTNTLELGIAGLPAVVALPMNAPERIPLEGIGHFLGLVPVVGTHLKRWAVRTFVETMNQPVSLTNRVAGEAIFDEMAGILHPHDVADRAATRLRDGTDLQRRRVRLAASMPRPGAADEIAGHVLDRLAGAPIALGSTT